MGTPRIRVRRLSRTSGRRKCACATATVTSVLVVVAIFAMSAFNLRQNRFNLNDVNVHLGDDIAISRVAEDFSSRFCSEYEVESWDMNEVYLLPGRAETNGTSRRVEHFEVKYVPWVFSLDSRGFYLLEGSSIHVDGCHTDLDVDRAGAEMILFRGHIDRHHHHRKHDQEDSEVKRVQIPASAVCNVTSDLPKLRFTVEEEGNYYIVLQEKEKKPDPLVDDLNSKRHYDTGSVMLYGNLTRTEYDVSKAREACKNHFLCRFSLGLDDDGADVVIRIRNNPVTPMAASSFTTHCHPRIMFWVAIFGGVPLMLVIGVITFWVWFYCVKIPGDDTRCTCKRHGCANADKKVASEAAGVASEASRGKEEGSEDRKRLLARKNNIPESSYGSVQ